MPRTAARRPTRWSRCRDRRPGPGHRPGPQGARAPDWFRRGRARRTDLPARVRDADAAIGAATSAVVVPDVAPPAAVGAMTGPSAGYGGISSSVAAAPILASARSRNTSRVEVAAEVPRLDLHPGNRIEHGPWFRHVVRSQPGHHRGQPERAAVAIEPGVDAGGIGVQRIAHLGRRGGEVGLGCLPPGEHADETVGLHLGRPEQLREPPGRDVPPHLHLPHPLLRMDVALREEQVVWLSAVIWAIPLRSRSTVTGACRPATWSVPPTWGSARPVTHESSPTPATTTTRTTMTSPSAQPFAARIVSGAARGRGRLPSRRAGLRCRTRRPRGRARDGSRASDPPVAVSPR